jgi:hypothetical protein
MKFAKGAILGMMTGTVIGVVNCEKITSMFNDTKRQMKKFKRKCGM